MPGVRVGRHARIRRAIIDRDVLIPRGALIGYDPEEDRRRHTVTEGGVVVVTAEDEPLIGPISEEALRAEAEADRGGAVTSDTGRSGSVSSRGLSDTSPECMAARFSTRAAIPRSKSMSGRATHSAARRCRRAPRPGEREALELRDGDKRRYLGKGVRKAVAHVNGEIAEALCGTRARSARDRPTCSSSSTARPPRAGSAPTRCSASRWPPRAPAAAAAARPLYEHLAQLSGRVPADGALLLPVPMMNILNGGAHADSSVDLQEFMVMPLGLPTFAEALRAGTEIFHALRVDSQEGRPLDRRRRRRRIRAESQVQPRGARPGAGGDRQGRASPPGATCSSRSTSPRASCGTTAQYVFKKSGEPTRIAGRDGRDVRRLGPRIPDRLHRGRRRRRRLGRLEGADPRARAIACSWSATMCS